nr:PspC domain-containing protein [uncultured Sphaerochaeta sp.]
MKLYRSKQGKVLGVCQGLADRTGYPVKYFRILFIAAAFFTLWWTLALYIAAALLLPVKRPEGYEPEGFGETLNDLKDDFLDFIGREYREFREAGRNRDQAGSGQPRQKEI